MADFPTGIPDIPQASVAETLFTMHEEAGHVPATNRILQNLVALAAKVGYGASTPGAAAAVLRRLASGQSDWGRVRAAEMQGGGTANQVLRTSDGDLCAFATLSGTDFGVGTIPLTRLAGIVPGNVVKADGTGNVQGQVSSADIGLGAIQTDRMQANAITQSAMSGSWSGSTAVATYGDITGSTVTLNNMAGGQLIAIASLCFSQSQTGAYATYFALQLDGAGAEQGEVVGISSNTGQLVISTVYRWAGLSGTHTVKGRWRVSASPDVAAIYSGFLVLLEGKR